MWALGAIPTLAPQHQDHLLRSSSVVQTVQYGKRSIQYRTFDSGATEVLRLTYKPTEVRAGGTSINLRTDPEGTRLHRLGVGWRRLYRAGADADSGDIELKG